MTKKENNAGISTHIIECALRYMAELERILSAELNQIFHSLAYEESGIAMESVNCFGNEVQLNDLISHFPQSISLNNLIKK
jgi:hypothetical protein